MASCENGYLFYLTDREAELLHVCLQYIVKLDVDPLMYEDWDWAKTKRYLENIMDVLPEAF